MKIISKGTIPKDRVYRVSCDSCSSKIEFIQGEGKIVYDQRDGNYISINCPVCTALITVALNAHIGTRG